MFGEVEARKDIWPQPKEKDGIAIFEMACPGWVGGNSDPVKVASQQFGFVDTIYSPVPMILSGKRPVLTHCCSWCSPSAVGRPPVLFRKC